MTVKQAHLCAQTQVVTVNTQSMLSRCEMNHFFLEHGLTKRADVAKHVFRGNFSVGSLAFDYGNWRQ